MKKFLSAALIFAACYLNAAVMERGPYIEDPQQTSVVLRWATDTPAPCWVEYGPEGNCSQIMAVSPKRKYHTLALHGLIPNTQFCYKIYVENNAGNGVQNPIEGSFKTLFTPERKIVSFLVIGNTANPADKDNYDIKARMAQAMSSYESDFIVHTGNISSTGLNEQEDSNFFSPYRRILRTNPVLFALGEDEYGAERKGKAGLSFLNNNFKKIHSMPWSKGTPNYYYIDTANARIVFIDTNNLYGAAAAPELTKDSAQYVWLRQTLATAEMGKWKIVVMHHPVYSSGETEDRLSRLLGPLFDAQKVNLVIQGRQGAYERTKPIVASAPAAAGPTYITIGGSGKFFEQASYDNAWSAKYFNVPHFAHIQIVDRKLSLRVYTQDNKRIDALDIYF